MQEGRGEGGSKTEVGEEIRKGSFQDMVRNNKANGSATYVPLRNSGTGTITAIDFNESFIVGCGMDGKVHVWEPKPSVVLLDKADRSIVVGVGQGR